MTKYVGYARVSTQGQGRSGLGLDAQEATIRRHLRDDDKLLLPVMLEIESGRKCDRPVLAAALDRCRVMGATLVVAKLDRLSRDRGFVATVLRSGVSVEFCDLPASKGATGTFLLGVMGEVAQLEAGLISERTKSALAEAKIRRGKAGLAPLGGYRGGPVVDARLGGQARRQQADTFAQRIGPTLLEMRAKGWSLETMAAELTQLGVVTPRRGQWTATTVRRALARVT